MSARRKEPHINNGSIVPPRNLQSFFDKPDLKHFRKFIMVRNDGGVYLGNNKSVPRPSEEGVSEEICLHWCIWCHANYNTNYDMRYVSKTTNLNTISIRCHLVNCGPSYAYIKKEVDNKRYEALDAALSFISPGCSVGAAKVNEQNKADFLNKLRVLNKARVGSETRNQVQAYANGQQRVTQTFEGTDVVQRRQEVFNEDLVAAFVKCNIPLNVLRNSAMKQFLVDHIDPKIQLAFDTDSNKPCDNVKGLRSYPWMRTKGLELFDDKLDLRVYRGLRDECYEKRSMVTIVVDGWSNKRCKSF